MAVTMETRPLTALLTLRNFHQQPGAAQQAAGATPTQPPALPPWSPTRNLPKRKTLPKRMGHLLRVGSSCLVSDC